MFSALDLLVDFTMRLCASIFEVKSFTKSRLTTGFMIAYVYVAGLLIVFLVKAVIRAAVEVVARSNAFGLTNAIGRERGIAAYRAWLPLERIRPANIAQEKWEEKFAWPADGKPPFPELCQASAWFARQPFVEDGHTVVKDIPCFHGHSEFHGLRYFFDVSQKLSRT